jgi:hypothetical protein
MSCQSNSFAISTEFDPGSAWLGFSLCVFQSAGKISRTRYIRASKKAIAAQQTIRIFRRSGYKTLKNKSEAKDPMEMRTMFCGDVEVEIEGIERIVEYYPYGKDFTE